MGIDRGNHAVEGEDWTGLFCLKCRIRKCSIRVMQSWDELSENILSVIPSFLDPALYSPTGFICDSVPSSTLQFCPRFLCSACLFKDQGPDSPLIYACFFTAPSCGVTKQAQPPLHERFMRAGPAPSKEWTILAEEEMCPG